MIKTMKVLILSFVTAGLVVLAGCSSTPTKVDTGAIKASTFNFVNKGAVPSANFAENRQPVHAMIQEAITKSLASKGVSRAADAGDVTVAYLIIVANNVSTTSINTYFGYGRDTEGLVDKAHEKFSIENKNPNDFEAGTLLIDIIDSKTFALLRRTYVVRPILRNPPADVRRARIQEAVDEALKDLRISK
jgi:outer membrane murein-binding lipoprotein Lpp